MQLEVGQQISFQGRTWLVFEIERSETTFIADKTSDELRGIHGTATNVRVLDEQFDSFGPGDIVEQLLEVVQLIVPGQHIYFIYNKRYYRRLKSATQSSDETSNRAPQGVEPRASGGIRNGGENTGEASSAQDGHGSAGDGGDTLRAGGRQGGQYAAAERGGGDAARNESKQRQPVATGGESVAELLARIRARSRVQS